MSRTRLSLLLTLPLLLAGTPAGAGPPERPEGRMTFDEVADGLRRYRREHDPERRRALIRKLAPRRDPRVAVVLGESLAESEFPYQELVLLAEYYLPDTKRGSTDSVWDWWRQNEADLRRRAKELP